MRVKVHQASGTVLDWMVLRAKGIVPVLKSNRNGTDYLLYVHPPCQLS